MRRQLGTVHTLKPRIYAHDPAADVADPEVPSYLVEPGEWPVYLRDGVIYWEMIGRPNKAYEVKAEKVSENLTTLTAGYDQPFGDSTVITSVTYTPERFKGFLTDEICLPGAQQRLRFDITEPLPTGKRARIITEIEHLTGQMFLYYGRKEDPELPVGAIEDAVAAGEISVEEIAATFAESFRRAFKP